MALTSKDHLFFVDKVEKIDICGSTMLQFTGSEFAKPTDFERLSYKHNLDTCENCRNNHAQTLAIAQEKFNRFPACCKPHGKLASAKWFNKKDFENSSKLLADKLFFTWHHILEFIDHANWQEEIFDFIEYILETFGSFPSECGEPLNLRMYKDHLEDLVKNIEGKQFKGKKILDFIRDKTNGRNQSDINVLLSKYNEWFRMFPFELSFFSNLKERFSNHIPIIESSHVNKYLSVTKATLLTKERLIENLVRITDQLLTAINTSTLYENELISDMDAHELELLLQQRRQKLKMGYCNESKDTDTRYRKILKEWLTDEIYFIKKIKPVAERVSEKQVELHNAILRGCQKMQENRIFWKVDENGRTRQILDLLPSQFFTKDQSTYGKSESGKKAGEVDGVILAPGNTEYFIEALNLDGIDKALIQRHIHKLESNYDSKGLLRKYLFIYCNLKDGAFEDFGKNYLEYVKNGIVFKFELIRAASLDTQYTNIQEVKSFHKREGREVALHHLLIKMPFRD